MPTNNQDAMILDAILADSMAPLAVPFVRNAAKVTCSATAREICGNVGVRRGGTLGERPLL